MSGTITGATTAQQAAQAANAQRTRLNATFDTFLTMLTTQLRNQDPTKAMDTAEMTQQLVQFASVEQQLAMNANMERLVALQQGTQLVSAAPLMGRLVEVEGERLALQDGAAALRLPAAGTARFAEITVLDSRGRPLRAERVALAAAPGFWNWDGRDTGGQLLPDGAYEVRVRGVTADGVDSPVSATVVGRATSVERVAGEVQLKLGQVAVPFGALRAVLGP